MATLEEIRNEVLNGGIEEEKAVDTNQEVSTNVNPKPQSLDDIRMDVLGSNRGFQVPETNPMPQPDTNSQVDGRSFWADTWDYLKSVGVGMAGGLLQALDNMNMEKQLYQYSVSKVEEKQAKDREMLIEQYGSIEEAQASGDPLADLVTKPAGAFVGMYGMASYDALRDAINEHGSLEKAAEAGDFNARMYIEDPDMYASYDGNDTLLDRGADALREKAIELTPDLDLDIIGSASEGDWEAAIYKLGVASISQAPQLLTVIGASALGNPQVGLAVVGVSSAGSTYQDLEDNENLTEAQKRGISGFIGLLEVVTEKFGSSAMMEDILNNPQARKGLTSGFKKLASKFMKIESFEEGLNQIISDYVMRMTGADPDITGAQMVRNTGNAMLSAFGTSVGMHTANYITNRNAGNVFEEEAKVTENTAKEVARKFNYDESKVPELQKQLQLAYDYGHKYNFNPEIVASLMKVESDFTNVDDNGKSTAVGSLQITETALKDLDRLGVKLEHPIDTPEGRVEAGVRYLQKLRDHYGFEKDELIAAYFSGATYVRKHGITDEVQHGQISNREYVERFKEAHSTLIGTDLRATEVTEEQATTAEEEAPQEQSQTALDNPVNIKKALNELGYKAGDINTATLDSDTLSGITQFQLDYQLDWDDFNIRNKYSLLSDNFKQTLKEALEQNEGESEVLNKILEEEAHQEVVDKINRTESEDVDNEQRQQKDATVTVNNDSYQSDFWDNYSRWAEEVVKKRKKDVTKEILKSIQSKKNTTYMRELSDLYFGQAQVTAEEAEYLRTMNKPANGDAINTTHITAEPEVLQAIELTGQAVEGEIFNRTTFDTVRDKYKAKYGELDEDGAREIANKLGLLKEDADQLLKSLDGALEIIYGLKEAVVSNHEATQKLAREIRDKGGDVSSLKLAKFRKLMALQKSLTGKLKGISRRTAQATALGNVNINGEYTEFLNLNEEDIAQIENGQSDLQQVIDESGGKKKIVELAKKVADAGDVAETTKLAREDKWSSRFGRALLKYRATNLLRNQQTWWRNILGQMVNMALEHLKNYSTATRSLPYRTYKRLRGGIKADDIRTLNEQKPMTYTEATRRLVAEPLWIMKSFFKPIVTMKDVGELKYGQKLSKFDLLAMMATNPKKFYDLFQQTQLESRVRLEQGRSTEETMSDLLSKKTRESTVGGFLASVLDQVEAISSLSSFGGLQLGDKPFEHGGYGTELAGQLHLLRQTKKAKSMSAKERRAYINRMKDAVLAVRKLKTLQESFGEAVIKKSAKEGLDFETAKKQLQDELTDGKLKDLTDEELQDAIYMDNMAMQHAKEMTWKDEFDKGHLGADIEGFARRHPWMRAITVFLHSPMKMFQKFNTWSNPFSRKSKEMRSSGNKRLEFEAKGRFATSILLTAGGIMLTGLGVITPPARNERERERMEAANRPPSSINIGGKWVSYTQAVPLNYYLSTVSSAYRTFVEMTTDVGNPEKTALEKGGEFLAKVAQSLFQHTLEQTMLRGVSDLFNALQGHGVDTYLLDQLWTLDPRYTLSSNWEDQEYFGFNPFYEDMVTTDDGIVKRDTFGKPIMKYDTFMGTRVEDDDEASPIRMELLRLGMTLPKISKVFTPRGVGAAYPIRLDDEQYHDLLKYLDEELHAEEKLNEIVTQSGWERIPEEEKKRIIRNTWEDIKAVAKAQLANDPEYLQKIREAQQEKRRQLQQGYLDRFIPGESRW